MNIYFNQIKNQMALILSGNPGYFSDIEKTRKLSLINTVSFIGLAFLIPLSVDVILRNQFILGIFDIFIIAIIIINLFILNRSGEIDKICLINVFSLGGLFLYLFLSGGISNTGPLWAFSYPLFAMYLLGTHNGLKSTLIFILVTYLVYLVPFFDAYIEHYPLPFHIRFLSIMLIITFVTFLFEKFRSVSHFAHIKKNDELKISINVLEEAESALKDARDKLEDRVSERTKKLEDVNSMLQLEIGARKEYEEKLMQTIEEKEVLMHEIHHRVKNNLQIISSLMSLQEKNMKDNNTHSIFKDCQSRISSMAIIHEKLYENEDIAEVNVLDYISDLAAHLYETMGGDISLLEFDIDVENIKLHIEKAIPCGLIINELITNSLKYAFSEQIEKPKIWIKLQKKIKRNNNQKFDFLLDIKDNGSGFLNDIDIENATTLGLRLVNKLSRQLEGQHKFIGNDGVHFQLEFNN